LEYTANGDGRAAQQQQQMTTMLPDGMDRCLMFLIRNDMNNNKDSCLGEMAAGVQEYR
jgi:hypothetical protein